jgi:hypothetical protein
VRRPASEQVLRHLLSRGYAVEDVRRSIGGLGRLTYEDGWLYCRECRLYFSFSGEGPVPSDRMGRTRCPICATVLRTAPIKRRRAGGGAARTGAAES